MSDLGMSYQKWHLLDDLLDEFNQAEGDGDDWFNIGPKTRNAIRSLRDHAEQLQASIELGDKSVCRGSFSFGSACGSCQRCKAFAFDWLCQHFDELDYWAVMQTGQHNPMKAVINASKVKRG